jgi:hypothetical protein
VFFSFFQVIIMKYHAKTYMVFPIELQFTAIVDKN